jgi:hydrogenase maturation protease
LIEGVLIVGYGSTLRSDDGLGRYAAERLAGDPRLEGASVIGCHQLTPELALDVSRATLVVLVDAGEGPAAGTFAIERVEASDGSGPTGSHVLGPAELVALADTLYGRVPEVFAVRVGVASLEVGDRLTPAVEAALPGLVDAVAEFVVARAAAGPTPAAPGRGETPIGARGDA